MNKIFQGNVHAPLVESLKEVNVIILGNQQKERSNSVLCKMNTIQFTFTLTCVFIERDNKIELGWELLLFKRKMFFAKHFFAALN